MKYYAGLNVALEETAVANEASQIMKEALPANRKRATLSFRTLAAAGAFRIGSLLLDGMVAGRVESCRTDSLLAAHIGRRRTDSVNRLRFIVWSPKGQAPAQLGLNGGGNRHLNLFFCNLDSVVNTACLVCLNRFSGLIHGCLGSSYARNCPTI